MEEKTRELLKGFVGSLEELLEKMDLDWRQVDAWDILDEKELTIATVEYGEIKSIVTIAIEVIELKEYLVRSIVKFKEVI